jgi:heat shock protein HtpX
MRASDGKTGGGGALFSTHPPTKERIAILRSMGGGAGLMDYDKAYQSVKGSGIIGAASLRSADELKMRGITSAPEKVDVKKQTREATDILHKLNNFLFVPCSCGVRIKIPPTFKKETFACPRCGANHNISELGKESQ